MNKSGTAVLILISATYVAFAADSPQFRGVDRTGVFPETGLLREWPEGGPKLGHETE